MYHTSTVTYGQIKYFYFPVTKNTGDMAIILNKTGPIGKNGDSVLVLNFQNDSTKSIDQWTYPRSNYFSVASVNNNSNLPEIIEICPRVLNEKCGNTSCVLMLGVIGSTKNLRSNFRLLAYTSRNRLSDKTPINA